MDSENILEENNTLEIPADVVATEAEENGQPQADNNDEELFLDSEGEQKSTPKTNMSHKQAYAAFKKEKEKRKNEKQLREESDARARRLEEQLLEVKQQLTSVTNPRPNPADYLDTEDFNSALVEWEKQKSTAPPAQTQTTAPQSQNAIIDDQAEYEFFSAEMELKNSFKDYDQSKESVSSRFEQEGMRSDLAIQNIVKYSKLFGVDPAKVVYALDKSPGMFEKVILAANQGEIAVSEAIKQAAGKVKSRKKVKIDSDPEPDIKSTGSINDVSKQLEAAKKAYRNDPNNIKLSNAYFDLKRKVKLNG